MKTGVFLFFFFVDDFPVGLHMTSHFFVNQFNKVNETFLKQFSRNRPSHMVCTRTLERATVMFRHYEGISADQIRCNRCNRSVLLTEGSTREALDETMAAFGQWRRQIGGFGGSTRPSPLPSRTYSARVDFD